MGGVQLQSQAMVIRVFTCGGKNYLEGYTLKSLFGSSAVLGSLDDYYEINDSAITEAMQQYERRSPGISLEKEYVNISREELDEHLYGREETVIEGNHVESDLDKAYNLKLKAMKDLREEFKNRFFIDEVIRMVENSKTHDFFEINSKLTKFMKDNAEAARSNPKFTDDLEDFLTFFMLFLEAQNNLDDELSSTETVGSSSFGM